MTSFLQQKQRLNFKWKFHNLTITFRTNIPNVKQPIRANVKIFHIYILFSFYASCNVPINSKPYCITLNQIESPFVLILLTLKLKKIATSEFSCLNKNNWHRNRQCFPGGYILLEVYSSFQVSIFCLLKLCTGCTENH